MVVLTVPNDGQSHDRGRVLRAACYVARCWEDLHEQTLEDYFDMEMDEDIQDTDDDEYMDGQEPVAEDDEYLVFRTRIVKDDNGNIVSANYGKIYGAIRTVGFFGAKAIYFNPTPNDVNMEEKQ